MDRKGQAFSVFQLLISAVVALAILLLLINIITMIRPIGQGDPPVEASKLVKDIAKSQGMYSYVKDVYFENGKGISSEQIAHDTEGMLEEGQVCVSAGDFSDNPDWRLIRNSSLSYMGTSRIKVRIAGLCSIGTRMDASYFDDTTVEQLDYAWFSNCECLKESYKCCVVAIKRSIE